MYGRAEKRKPGGCPSPATAARIMPPPSTGRFLGPTAHTPPSHGLPQTSSTPRPQQRKKRRRAAQRGHVLLTQESPSTDSPHEPPSQGEPVCLCPLVQAVNVCHATMPGHDVSCN